MEKDREGGCSHNRPAIRSDVLDLLLRCIIDGNSKRGVDGNTWQSGVHVPRIGRGLELELCEQLQELNGVAISRHFDGDHIQHSPLGSPRDALAILITSRQMRCGYRHEQAQDETLGSSAHLIIKVAFDSEAGSSYSSTVNQRCVLKVKLDVLYCEDVLATDM